MGGGQIWNTWKNAIFMLFSLEILGGNPPNILFNACYFPSTPPYPSSKQQSFKMYGFRNATGINIPFKRKFVRKLSSFQRTRSDNQVLIFPNVKHLFTTKKYIWPPTI